MSLHPPAFYVVWVATAPIATAMILCGAVLLVRDRPWQFTMVGDRIREALGCAMLCACILGVYAGVLEGAAIVYIDSTLTGTPFRSESALILLWGLVASIAGFNLTLWSIYRERQIGSATRPSIARNGLAWGGIVLLSALLLNLDTHGQPDLLATAAPLGFLVIVSPVRWWVGCNFRRYQHLSANLFIIIGTLLMVAVYVIKLPSH